MTSPVGYAGSMTHEAPAPVRTPQAKAELDPTHRINWKIADVKVATRKRNKARLAKPGTVFTSDPQSLAPTYVPKY